MWPANDHTGCREDSDAMQHTSDGKWFDIPEGYDIVSLAEALSEWFMAHGNKKTEIITSYILMLLGK